MRTPLVGIAMAALATAVILPLAASAAAAGPALPSHRLSPGAFTSSTVTVCVGRTLPAISVAEQRVVLSRYRIAWSRHQHYVIQHVVPVNLGGTNATRNLWPQPAGADVATFATTDRTLRSLVCASHRLALHTAQHAIAVNWYVAFQTYQPELVVNDPTTPPTTAPPILLVPTSVPVQTTAAPTTSTATTAPPTTTTPPTTTSGTPTASAPATSARHVEPRSVDGTLGPGPAAFVEYSGTLMGWATPMDVGGIVTLHGRISGVGHYYCDGVATGAPVTQEISLTSVGQVAQIQPDGTQKFDIKGPWSTLVTRNPCRTGKAVLRLESGSDASMDITIDAAFLETVGLPPFDD